MPPENNPVSPSYQIPGTKPPANKKKSIFIVLGVLVVLALAYVFLMFTPFGAHVRSLFTPVSVPQELQSASFLSDKASANTTMYHFQGGAKTTEDAGAVLVSATQSGNGSARITRTADGTFAVLLDGKTVLTDKIPRIGIDRSPDGTSVVFAEGATTTAFVSPATAPLFGLGNRGWSVAIYKPATHTTTSFGAGSSPFYIDASHIGWIAPAGLAVADLATGKSTLLVKNLKSSALTTTLVSPDHTVIAWYDTPARKLVAYKITATSATALPVTTLPVASSAVRPIHSLSLGNDSVYMLRLTPTETDILKQPFGQAAVQIGKLPPSLFIGRLLIGSQ